MNVDRNTPTIRDLRDTWPTRLARVRQVRARTDPSRMTRPPRDPVERSFLAERGLLGPFIEARPTSDTLTR